MAKGEWTEHKTDEGRVYYFNKEKKLSTWKRPPELSVWEEKWDEKSKRKYYFNRESKVSEWKPPENAIVRPYVPSKRPKVTAETEEKQETETKRQRIASPLRKAVQAERDTHREDPIIEEAQPYVETATIISDRSSVEQKVEAATIVKDSTRNSGIKLSEGNQEAQTVLEKLEKRDSIMEDDVIATINDFLKNHTGTDTSGPELVVQTLAGSYRGYAEMTKLMAGWLDSVQPPVKPVDEDDPDAVAAAANQCPTAEDVIYDFLKSTILQRYQPKLLEHVLEAKAEPLWLQNMLDDSKWRLMLIELAEKHKSCGLLHYIVQRISEAGHHKEIASVTSASTYFSVFHGVFTDAIERIQTRTSDEITDDVASLRKICGQNAYTYMYTQHFLRQFEAAAGKDNEIAARKMRRIRQELHAATYEARGTKLEAFVLHKRKDIVQKFPLLSRCILNMLVEGECSEITAADLKTVFKDPSESPPVAHIRDPMILRMLIDALFNSSGTLSACRKTDILYILSYAVCAKDPRDVSETTQGDVAVKLIDFDKTMQYLEQASDICNSDHTLGYNISSSGVVEELSSLMQYPVVAMGVLQWIRTAINSPSFHNSSLFHVCFPAFLQLIRTSVDAHPLQWPSNFEILVESLRLRPDLNPVKALDLKRDILQAMVHMMTRGYVLPVLQFVYRSTSELDAALLRNFVTFVMKRVSPPYSTRFAQTMTRLLLHAKIQTAIKTSPVQTQKRLLEFIKFCRQTEGLMSKQQSQSLKTLKNAFQ